MEEKNNFIAEANIMKQFGKPWHPNVSIYYAHINVSMLIHTIYQVIRLLGVCTQADTLMMIIELAARGDLKNFLRECRPTLDVKGMLSETQQVKMAVDIASGMAFLASRKFVHRDLACRFVLIIILVIMFIYFTGIAWLHRILRSK